MTAVAQHPGGPEPGGTFLRSSGALAQRSLRNIGRLPSAFVPALVMPLFQVIAFSGAFFAVTKIPGFPTDRSINWFLPLGVIMGCSFAGVGIGFSTIRDIESGFYDRLRMAPAPRSALLLGPLLAAWMRAAIVIVVVTLFGLVMGARVHQPLGLATLAVAGLGIATMGTGWGLGLAFRFGDMRAAALMQLTLFLVIFLSTAQVPLTIMQGWLYDVARINPITRVLALARQGFLDGVTWHDTWPGIVAIAILGGLAVWFAERGLRRLSR